MRNHNSKKESLNLVLRRLIKDISKYQQAETFHAKISENFDTFEVIGSEYILTNDKIAVLVKDQTFRTPFSPLASKNNPLEAVTFRQKSKLKWPTIGRLKF